MSLQAPLVALVLLLLAHRAAAAWTPFANMTALFVMNAASKCAPITDALARCLQVARTLEPSDFSEHLAVDEQSVSENMCTHQTFYRLAEGASLFGVDACLASALNASFEADVLVTLIEGTMWGVVMHDDLKDPEQDWDLRLYEDDAQRQRAQDGIRRTQALVRVALEALPQHAALRKAADAWDANARKYFQPLLRLQCEKQSGELVPCEDVLDSETLEKAREKHLRAMKEADARDREERSAAAARAKRASGRGGLFEL